MIHVTELGSYRLNETIIVDESEAEWLLEY